MKYFNNPVSNATKPDPYILEMDGLYYCYSTHVDGVKVSLSHDLISWEDHGFAYSDESEKSYWAPSVIYINGIFYLYYSSVPAKDNDTLDETLKCATSTDVFGPFIFKKQFFDYFSIDSHPYLYNGDLYMFYSTNILGCDDRRPGTSILLDKMIDPFTMEGNAKIIVRPSMDKEIYAINRFNDNRHWHTIEGAAIITRNGKLYVLYSANAYVNVDYFVNYSVGTLKDDLRDIEFKKYPNDEEYHALLSKNGEVSGTGHNTVCKGPNLIEDFIVYHGRNNEEPLLLDKEQRTMRIDRLFFEGDKLLCDGPHRNNIEVPKTCDFINGNIILTNEKLKCDVKGNYIARVWWKAIKDHTSIRYGINIGKALQLEFNEGLSSLNVYKVCNNIKLNIKKIELGIDYNHRVSHSIMIKRIFDAVFVILDDGKTFKFNERLGDGIEIYSTFSSINLIDFRVSNLDELENDNLIYISKFISCSTPLLVSGDGVIEIRDSCSFEFLKLGLNELDIYPLSNDSYVIEGGNKKSIKNNESLQFKSNKGEGDDKLVLNYIGIRKYRFTKNCN
jgi:GH43 family beta-xylosidase